MTSSSKDRDAVALSLQPDAATTSFNDYINDDQALPHEPRATFSSTADASMAFLQIFKKVQQDKRIDRMRRARNLRESMKSLGNETVSSGDNEAAAPKSFFKIISDRTPLLGKDTSTTSVAVSEIESIEEEKLSASECLFQMFFGKGIVSLCLLAIPFSLWAVHHGWSDTWIFWLNFFVMIPLASILGDFTEEVAMHTNEATGGLINASFGNAVEVVVAIQALRSNEIRVVQASLLGSIFSNLLLVLGCCFFFGGLYHKEQTFNGTAASANIGLLALSSIALVLPTPFAQYYQLHDQDVLIVSRISAIFLLFMYVQLLTFQLHTHKHIFQGEADAEIASMSLWMSCAGLLIVTLLVAVFSEYLVGSIEGFTVASGISRTFVGIILLPIVGNAVEHVAAVTVSMKNKMDLAMGIAVGSSTQISLFVVPLTVLSGWIMGRDMTLNFPHFEITLYVLSLFTVSVVVSTAKSNWLVGSLLVTTYCLIAVGFWFEKVKNSE